MILYLAYWGALEPLGQALVVPVVMRLAHEGAGISLVTFEKPADVARAEAVATLTRSLAAEGVTWLALPYHKRPRVLATLYDVVHGWRRGVAAGRRAGAELVVGRTFVGGLLGRAVATTLRRPFVYHNEGFYPDEMVDGGFWRAGSFQHRMGRRLEAALYRHADGVIVLSDRARESLRRGPLVGSETPVAVVPSAIDLDRFGIRRPEPLPGRELRLVHLGGVGGRYRLDAAARLARAACARRPTRLDVLTAATDLARRTLAAAGLPESCWSVRTLPPNEVPAALRRYDAGCAFLVEGLSEHGGSPTKVGEYWATGLPVVTTATVGDVGDIVERERVGVVVREHSDAGYGEAVDRLLSLLDDTDLPTRCRLAAETHYSVPQAVLEQLRLYEQLLDRARRDR